MGKPNTPDKFRSLGWSNQPCPTPAEIRYVLVLILRLYRTKTINLRNSTSNVALSSFLRVCSRDLFDDIVQANPVATAQFNVTGPLFRLADPNDRVMIGPMTQFMCETAAQQLQEIEQAVSSTNQHSRLRFRVEPDTGTLCCHYRFDNGRIGIGLEWSLPQDPCLAGTWRALWRRAQVGGHKIPGPRYDLLPARRDWRIRELFYIDEPSEKLIPLRPRGLDIRYHAPTIRAALVEYAQLFYGSKESFGSGGKDKQAGGSDDVPTRSPKLADSRITEEDEEDEEDEDDEDDEEEDDEDDEDEEDEEGDEDEEDEEDEEDDLADEEFDEEQLRGWAEYPGDLSGPYTSSQLGSTVSVSAVDDDAEREEQLGAVEVGLASKPAEGEAEEAGVEGSVGSDDDDGEEGDASDDDDDEYVDFDGDEEESVGSADGEGAVVDFDDLEEKAVGSDNGEEEDVDSDGGEGYEDGDDEDDEEEYEGDEEEEEEDDDEEEQDNDEQDLVEKPESRDEYLEIGAGESAQSGPVSRAGSVGSSVDMVSLGSGGSMVELTGVSSNSSTAELVEMSDREEVEEETGNMSESSGISQVSRWGQPSESGYHVRGDDVSTLVNEENVRMLTARLKLLNPTDQQKQALSKFRWAVKCLNNMALHIGLDLEDVVDMVRQTHSEALKEGLRSPEAPGVEND